MNIQASGVLAPSAPKSMADTGLSMVMMRDIALKTIFRMNIDQDLIGLVANFWPEQGFEKRPDGRYERRLDTSPARDASDFSIEVELSA